MQTSSSGPFKVLGDQLRRDPELYITDPFKVLINVVEHKCVYPTVTVSIHSKFLLSSARNDLLEEFRVVSTGNERREFLRCK